MLNLDGLKSLTSGIAKEAGGIILSQFNKNKTFFKKDMRDVATQTDLEVEDFLKKALSELIPEAGFIMEEHQDEKKGEYNWIIDPIDQTKNYIALMPLFYTQFALLKNGEPILSQIYQPFSDQLFTAIKGGGSFLNGQNILAKSRIDPEESIVDIDLRGGEDLNLKIPVIQKLMANFYRVRMVSGSFSPYLVTGAIDAQIFFYQNKLYDLLPRFLIFQESGLIINEIKIADAKKITIVAKEELFEKIDRMIKEIKWT